MTNLRSKQAQQSTHVTRACGGVGYVDCPSIQRANNPHFEDPGWALLAGAVSAAVKRGG